MRCEHVTTHKEELAESSIMHIFDIVTMCHQKKHTQKLTRPIYTKAHSMVFTALGIENYTQRPYITVYIKFWSTREKDINTRRKGSAIIYASSCSCECSLGEKPREMQRFLRSSGNSVTTTMFSGWNRIWNKNSAFQS